MKSRISLDIGAEPVIIYLQFPPKIYLVFLKTKSSHIVEVVSPLVWRSLSLVANALSTKDFSSPVKLSNYDLANPYILYKRRGTMAINVGFTNSQSSFILRTSPP